MREIKFRAWDKRRNIFGKVVSLEQNDSAWYKAHHDGHAGRVSLENHKNEKDCGSWGSWIEFVDIEQFTGLRDKSGKEIYEGDIVRTWVDLGPAGEEEVVTAITICPWGVNLQKWTFDESYYPEVIGNIHENPELLK